MSFCTPDGDVEAVRGATFAIERGRTLALVGASGSGKTATAHAILRVLPSAGRILGGSVVLRSRRAGAIDTAALRENSPALFQVRGGIASMIFQEPISALSPLHTIGSQVAEAVLVHERVSQAAARDRALAMLQRVGIAPRFYDRYPQEFSGGMRQRAVAAMALVGRPELLIADEPTSGLDATIQSQVLALIKELQSEIGFSVLLITHDFSVVSRAADEVAVMDAGRIVERGAASAVLRRPKHPYTRALLDALPARRYREAREWPLEVARAS